MIAVSNVRQFHGMRNLSRLPAYVKMVTLTQQWHNVYLTDRQTLR